MDFKNLYKSLRRPTIAETLAIKSQNLIAERQLKQREVLWSKRNVEGASPVKEPVPKEKKKNDRAEMLKKWKAEKQKRLEEAKKNKKPPFRVGVVHRKITGSPVLKDLKKFTNKVDFIEKENKNEEVKKTGVVTRSRAKVLKDNTNQLKTKPLSVKKNDKKLVKTNNKNIQMPTSNSFKVPECVSKLPLYNQLTFPCSPSFSKRKSRFSVSTEHLNNVENSVTLSQGKIQKGVEISLKTKVEGSKKVASLSIPYSPKIGKRRNKSIVEMIEEINISHEVSTVEVKKPETPEVIKQKTPEPTLSSQMRVTRSAKKSAAKNDAEEKEKTEFQTRIASFREYIEGNTKRLQDTCNRWKCIYLEVSEVPSDVEGEIDSVIGKTNLLTSDKFMQFKDLIDKCEGGDPLIKLDDLQGFQDWVSLEVEKISEDFDKLEKRKCNNWESETPEVKVEVKKEQQKKEIKKAAKKPVGKSNIRSHIMNARKMLKEENAKAMDVIEDVVKIVTPVRKGNVLKDIMNSGTINRSRKESVKSIKNKTNDSLIYVDENRTPKSILRTTPRNKNLSVCRVTFNQENPKSGRKGLDEKYFRPLLDDENSPWKICQKS